MVGQELAIEQLETTDAQPRDQPCQRDLRRAGCAADHGFAEKRLTEREAVQAAGETLTVPDLDRMGQPHFVQPDEGLFDRAVDPCFRPVGGAFGA
jgi:hypothetical protein